MARDFALNNIARNILEELTEYETTNEAEEQQLTYLLEENNRVNAVALIFNIIDSQAKSIKEALENGCHVLIPKFGNFQIRSYNAIIYDLMLEEAKARGYDDLTLIKSPAIMKGIKLTVRRKYKEILQNHYWERRKLNHKNNPQVLTHDFRPDLKPIN